MSTGALIMMIVWQGFITCMAVYFFYKVLTTKKKSDQKDEDSFQNNTD